MGQMAVVEAAVPDMQATKASFRAPLVGSIMPSQHEMSEAFYEDTENATNLNVDDEEDSDEEDGSSWDALSTWYMPLLLLWLKRSMFGTANLVRSLIVGQCLRLFLTGDVPKWAQLFADPHAWPPPAFTVLAILTVVAFVVHPDGLTWFMLGKFRDAILSLLHSFASCWTMFIQDYGIITTTIALMTLAGIGCLLGILLKNALPKAYSAGCQSQTSDKKKKKRKGVKGKGGRIRQFRATTTSTTLMKSNPENETEASLQQSADKRELQEMNEPHQPKEEDRVTKVSAILPEKRPVSTEMSRTRFSAVDSIPEFSETSMSTETRGRMQSMSTSDTLVDDGSYDSTSVLSFASAPTAVTVGSTGKSESELSLPAKNKRHEKSRRKHQQVTTDQGSKRGGRKTFPADDVERPPQDPPQKLSLKSTAPKSREDSRYQSQAAKPPTTGRFANLKEKDKRFDSSRRNQTHGRVNGSRGKNFGGGRGYNMKHSTPIQMPASAPAKSVINATPFRPQQKLLSPIANHGSTVQFGSPYSSSPDRQCLKKQELVSTLARVGLVGNDAASIVSNVPDVDALTRLSDVQYQLYGVTTEKQEKLNSIFGERHGRRNAVRPPPGLSTIVHDEPPTLFGSPNHGNPPVNLASTLGTQSYQMYAYDEFQFVGFMDDEESRIEAELQELGGKMIGSILDF